MDFFDYLFGNKEEKDLQGKESSRIEKSSNQTAQSGNNTSYKGVDPVEQYVKESVADLKKHMALSTEKLEPEAIYLAAFLVLKGTHQIDFNLNYFSEGLLDQIPSGDYSVADKVFSYMKKYGEGYYGKPEYDHGIEGYKMNIELCPDYGDYIKHYFIRAHKIDSGKEYMYFKSPRNCLWRGGVKCSDSYTQRLICYKFSNNSFEIMLPPYNPLVTGRIIKRTSTSIQCQSNDGKRSFIFNYIDSINPDNLDYVEMYRNDKGDMVSYHKS